MLLLKYGLMTGAVGLFLAAAAVLWTHVATAIRHSRPLTPRWRLAGRLAIFGVLALLPSRAIGVVPSGYAGVRISQLSGTLNGTAYPGTHLRSRSATCCRKPTRSGCA